MWNCESSRNFQNHTAQQLAKQCTKNGYLLETVAETAFDEHGTCTGELFQELSLQCVCYNQVSGCLCDQKWAEGCSGSRSFQVVLIATLIFFAGVAFVVSIWALWHLAHTLQNAEHTKIPIPFNTRFLWVIIKGEILMLLCQNELGTCKIAVENILGVLPCHLCPPTPQTAVKIKVLRRVSSASFCIGIWLLNASDSFFNTYGIWWFFVFSAVPNLMFAYEAILLEWRRVTQHVKMHFIVESETNCRMKYIPENGFRWASKILLMLLAIFATWAEFKLRRCSEEFTEIDDQVDCTKKLIVHGMTKTTWHFFIYSSAVVAYAASLLLSFIFWGYRLHTYTVAIANGDKLVQESEKIISFLKALSTSVAILVAISIIYAIYPYYTMKTALSFMLVSITALFRMMHCASRCIRVPPVEYSTTEFHQCWCSSCFKKKRSFNRRCNQNSLQEQADNNEKWLSRVNPRSLQPTSKTETTFIAPALPPPPAPALEATRTFFPVQEQSFNKIFAQKQRLHSARIDIGRRPPPTEPYPFPPLVCSIPVFCVDLTEELPQQNTTDITPREELN